MNKTIFSIALSMIMAFLNYHAALVALLLEK